MLVRERRSIERLVSISAFNEMFERIINLVCKIATINMNFTTSASPREKYSNCRYNCTIPRTRGRYLFIDHWEDKNNSKRTSIFSITTKSSNLYNKEFRFNSLGLHFQDPKTRNNPWIHFNGFTLNIKSDVTKYL